MQLQPKILSSSRQQKIYLIQTPYSRALTVGGIKKEKNHNQLFLPGRLLLGAARAELTYRATVASLQMPAIYSLIKNYQPVEISTITVLRETLSCRLGDALGEIGMLPHYGDAFIGATHIKGNGEIKTAYLYENTEGLVDQGLWIIADSICMGRNLLKTLEMLLTKFHPKEIILLAPLASVVGTDAIGKLLHEKQVPVTFIAWAALFGVDEKTLYDMPWGHSDTIPFDVRDQEVFVKMFGPKLCVGGDFGNDYFCPPLAEKLYHEQLNEHSIVPQIPSVEAVLNVYKKEEIITF